MNSMPSPFGSPIPGMSDKLMDTELFLLDGMSDGGLHNTDMDSVTADFSFSMGSGRDDFFSFGESLGGSDILMDNSLSKLHRVPLLAISPIFLETIEFTNANSIHFVYSGYHVHNPDSITSSAFISVTNE